MPVDNNTPPDPDDPLPAGDESAETDFRTLVLRYLDNASDPGATAKLNELLGMDPAYRREFIRCCIQAADIREHIRERAGHGRPPSVFQATGPASEALSHVFMGDPVAAQRRGPLAAAGPRLPGPRAWLVAASLLLGLSLLAVLLLRGAGDAGWPADAVACLDIAVSPTGPNVGSADETSVWYRPGDELVTTRRQTLRVTMRGGAVLILSEGSSLVVESGDRVVLTRGKLVATAPGGAAGFVVQTPSATVTDLGTEFGVRVADNGESAVHLFDGVVRVQPSSTGPPLTLSEGQAAVTPPNAPTRLVEAGMADVFVRSMPTSVFASAALDQQPVLYLPVGSEEDHVGLSAPLRQGAKSFDASFAPARFVRGGGVAGDGVSVGFESSDEGVRVGRGFAASVKTGQYTVALWVRPAHLGSQNLITATSGRGPAYDFGPQVRLRPDGTVEHVGPGGRPVQSSGRRLDAGAWHMVVVSMDAGGAMRLYLDGSPAATAVLSGARPDSAMTDLVVGGPAGQQQGIEHHASGYDGELDELLVYDRALPPEVVFDLYQSAR